MTYTISLLSVSAFAMVSALSPAPGGAQSVAARPTSFHFQCGERAASDAIPLAPGAADARRLVELERDRP
jgi:hypothetical protein